MTNPRGDAPLNQQIANTGYLEGYKCPECGNTESFEIIADVLIRLDDAGIADYISGTDWDNNSNFTCTWCHASGIGEDFYSKDNIHPDA